MEHMEIKAQIGEVQLQLENLQTQANVLLEKKQTLINALIKEMNKPKVEQKPTAMENETNPKKK